MHIIDQCRFREALKKKGYGSIGELASGIGVHRNTIHHYLSGNGVFPDSIEKMMSALGLKPQDFIIDIPDEAAAPIEKIAPIIDRLHEEFPDVTFILFGSRAKGTAAKYSDWDIGALRAGGLPHDEYKKVLIRKDELVEDFPYFVDMVNLDRADAAFLREASRGWVFLTGRLADWIEFKKGVAA